MTTPSKECVFPFSKENLFLCALIMTGEWRPEPHLDTRELSFNCSSSSGYQNLVFPSWKFRKELFYELISVKRGHEGLARQRTWPRVRSQGRKNTDKRFLVAKWLSPWFTILHLKLSFDLYHNLISLHHLQ